MQELCVAAFIDNDTKVYGGPGENPDDSDQDENSDAIQEEEKGPSMILLTGPNYSGKSVYLKQVRIKDKTLKGFTQILTYIKGGHDCLHGTYREVSMND